MFIQFKVLCVLFFDIIGNCFSKKNHSFITVTDEVVEIPSWDAIFMSMVYLISMKSKDQSTHIGSVIVGPKNEIISLGFNSFPMGIDDSVEERQERPEKYSFFEHGERNSIYLATRNGVSLKNSKMYTQGMPCTDCCRGIIQVGIEEVILHKSWDDLSGQEKWKDSAIRSKQMFMEAGVKIRYYNGPILAIKGLRGGTTIAF